MVSVGEPVVADQDAYTSNTYAVEEVIVTPVCGAPIIATPAADVAPLDANVGAAALFAGPQNRCPTADSFVFAPEPSAEQVTRISNSHAPLVIDTTGVTAPVAARVVANVPAVVSSAHVRVIVSAVEPRVKFPPPFSSSVFPSPAPDCWLKKY